MTSTMEQCSSIPQQRRDEPDLDLKEWSLKARISREITRSRRFSSSNLRSFREDSRSFRSNITISSTVSSPGQCVKEEIDPSTYSFTTALKALQAKTVYTWEYISPDGFTLNSKWTDAEKYICNPLSGEVPLECLSAKTPSGRSFRSFTSRITMSAPLIYPSHMQQMHAKSPVIRFEDEVKMTPQEKKRSTTRDMGTQSTPLDISSSSSTAAPSPSKERAIKLSEAEGGDSTVSSEKLKSEKEEYLQVEERETREKQQQTEASERGKREKVRKEMMCRCSNSRGGCLSLRGFLWMHREKKHRSKPKNTNGTYHALPC